MFFALNVNLFFFCVSEKGHLNDIAAAKIKELTAELEGTDKFDPVEKIQNGFAQFKKEIYEYVYMCHHM